MTRSSMVPTTMVSRTLSIAGRRPSLRYLCLACSALVSLGFAGQADAQQIPANPKTLAATIAAAKSGETIVLAAGDYGPLTVGNRRYSGAGLTIQPRAGAKAVFTSVTIDSCTGVTLKDVDVEIQMEPFGVGVYHSDHVDLTGLTIHALNKVQNGMMIRYSNNITVENSTLNELGTGINMLVSDHIQILKNTISGIQSDAIRGASSHVDVIGNHATDFHPMPGDHPDFIQFWSTSEGGTSTGNRIMDNVYERGQGESVQGVFIEDNKDITISGNAMLGTMFNAIAMARTQNAVVENNFIQSYPDMRAQIITRGKSADVTIRNNVSPAVVNYDGDGANTGYKDQGNRPIGAAKPGDASAMRAWLAKRAQPQQSGDPAAGAPRPPAG